MRSVGGGADALGYVVQARAMLSGQGLVGVRSCFGDAIVCEGEYVVCDIRGAHRMLTERCHWERAFGIPTRLLRTMARGMERILAVEQMLGSTSDGPDQEAGVCKLRENRVNRLIDVSMCKDVCRAWLHQSFLCAE